MLHNRTRSPIYCYLSNIIIYPPTCVFSLLYLFGFGPGVASVASVLGGVAHRGFLFVYILPRCSERGVRGHLFNWLILSPVLWQSKCYLQPHCTGRTLPHTFRDEDGKSKMEIWPRAGASGNESSLKDVLTNSSNEMYSISSNLTLPLCLTVQWKVYRVWAFIVIALLSVREVFVSLTMMNLTSFVCVPTLENKTAQIRVNLMIYVL